MAGIGKNGLAQWMGRFGTGASLMNLLGRSPRGTPAGLPDPRLGLLPPVKGDMPLPSAAVTLPPIVSARIAAYQEGIDPGQIKLPSDMRRALRDSTATVGSLFAEAPEDAAKVGTQLMRILGQAGQQMAFGATSTGAGESRATFYLERGESGTRPRISVESSMGSKGASETSITMATGDGTTVAQIRTAPKMADGKPVTENGRPVLTREVVVTRKDSDGKVTSSETFAWDVKRAASGPLRLSV